MARPAAMTPECPRCGYDLSGAVAAWAEGQCPCQGRCSECGLEMLWRDVLNPAYRLSDLFFETARRRLTLAFFRTWWQSLRPWRLWRGVQMQFPVHAARLAVFVVLGAALVWVSCGVAVSAAMYVTRMLVYSARGAEWWDVLVYLIVSGRMARQFWPAWTESTEFPVPPWLAAGCVWMMASLFMLRLVPQTLRRANVRTSHVVRIWAYSLVGAPLLLFAPVAGDCFLGCCSWLRTTVAPMVGDHRGAAAVGLLTLWGGWMVACWGAAWRHYLRLERPWLVAGLLVLLSGLAVVTCGVVAAVASESALRWMMNELG